MIEQTRKTERRYPGARSLALPTSPAIRQNKCSEQQKSLPGTGACSPP